MGEEGLPGNVCSHNNVQTKSPFLKWEVKGSLAGWLARRKAHEWGIIHCVFQHNRTIKSRSHPPPPNSLSECLSSCTFSTTHTHTQCPGTMKTSKTSAPMSVRMHSPYQPSSCAYSPRSNANVPGSVCGQEVINVPNVQGVARSPLTIRCHTKTCWHAIWEAMMAHSRLHFLNIFIFFCLSQKKLEGEEAWSGATHGPATCAALKRHEEVVVVVLLLTVVVEAG